MARRTVQTQKTPAKMADGSAFACQCGSTEFRAMGEGDSRHLFCRCGQVYTSKDLQVEEPA